MEPYETEMASSSRTSLDSTAPSSASHLDLPSQAPASAIRNSRLRPRRGSTASSVLSFGSSGTVLQDWKTAQNVGSSAISTLVDNPSSRAVIPRPTTRDIPPVNLSPIPKIKSSEFSDYLSIAGEFEKYRKAKDQGLEEHIRLTKNEPISPTPSIADFAGFAQVAGLGPGSVTDSASRKKTRRPNLAATPLSAVPQIYFDENFRLENPRVFDVVSEKSDIIRPKSSTDLAGIPGRQDGSSSRKALASNAILQEKLSWYMDTIEVHLIQSISTASSTFFAALGDLRELHSEVAESVQKIDSIRAELAKIDEEQALKGLEVVRLRRRRDNVARLERAAKQMQDVVEGISDAKRKVEEGEIAQALDQVDLVESLIAGEDPKREGAVYDLRRVASLQVIEDELANLRQNIGKAFEKRFVDALLSDLRNHVQSVQPSETLQRFAQSFSRGLNRQSSFGPQSGKLPIYAEVSDKLRSELKAHLQNLQRAKSISSAIAAYRTAAGKEVKHQIAEALPIKDDEALMDSEATGVSIGGIRSTQAVSAVAKIGPLEAENMFIKLYTGVSELVRRLGTQQKILLDLTMNLGETSISGMLSPRLQGIESDNFAEVVTAGLSDLIAPVLEVAQSKLVIVLRARDRLTSSYNAVDFFRYFTLNRQFSSECEAMTGRMSSTFLTIVNNQTIEFVKKYHDERRASLAEELGRDKWTSKDFDEESEQILKRIVSAATGDPEIWFRHVKVFEDTRATPEQEETQGTNGTNGTESKDKVRAALVDEQKFVLPSTSMTVLREIEKYEESIAMIPNMTVEIATNLLDYLKLFNSISCQLILGAGATKSAGLKHITTRHLALASQALSFVVALIPYLREFVRRHGRGAAANVLSEFDKVKRIYQDHQQVIHDKFITIMVDRLRAHLKTIRKLDWEETPAGESGPNAYMETLVKDTSVVHKALVKHLIPMPTLLYVMQQVFNEYKTKLVEDGYGQVEIRSEGAKARMLRDVEYLNDKLGKMEGCGNTGEIILEAVRNKVVRSGANGASSNSNARTQ